MSYVVQHTAGPKTVSIKLENSPYHSLRLSPNDFSEGIKHRDQVYASTGIKGRLQEDRLIAAVLLLLQTFPSLGARLDLGGVPSLDMRNPEFPLSCTSWPEGSAKELYGQTPMAHSMHLPIYDRLEVQAAARGEAPLFKLRLTLLGDGNSALSVSWLHILVDGHLIELLRWLSVAYTDLTLVTDARTPLPAPTPERPFWPADLKNYMPTPSIAVNEQELLQAASQLLAVDVEPEPAQLPGTFVSIPVKQGVPIRGKDEIKKLLIPVFGSGSYVSSGDVLLGLAWMLANEMKGVPRPGQGPEGFSTAAATGISLRSNGIPSELRPRGQLCDLLAPLRFTCISTGKMQDLPDSPQALESSLALASFSYRKAILALRKVPVQTLRQSAYKIVQAPQPLRQEPDAIVASWGQLMDSKTDFGAGNLGLTGICPLAPSLMFVLPDGDDFILRIPVAEAAKAKLLGSPALDLIVDRT